LKESLQDDDKMLQTYYQLLTLLVQLVYKQI